MSEKTQIAWCDSTLNFWEGCTKVSDGCKNCYAEARDKRFTGGKLWGRGATRRKSKSAFKLALDYNYRPWICDECGDAFTEAETRKTHAVDGAPHCCPGKFHRRRIFSLSLGDIGDPEIPLELFNESMVTIDKCRDVVWILCTKRPGEFLARWKTICRHWGRTDFTLQPNLIMLTSVENQECADERIPLLLEIPAACHGLSLEPLLGPVEVEKFIWKPRAYVLAPQNYLKWLIIGCESGHNRRDCKLEWARSLVEQGKFAQVATFVKQLQDSDGMVCKDVSEFPDDLKIQEWPKGF